MATVTDVFVSGSVGNLIFYRRMGKSCARIKRVNLKQTAATRMRGINFGMASRAGKALRSGLYAAMPVPKDRSLQSRVCGSIAKWIGLSAVEELMPTDKVPFVSELVFTKEQPFDGRFKVQVTVSQTRDNVIAVSIEAFVPALQISAPAGTALITLVISVAGCLLKTGEPFGSETQAIEIPYNDSLIPAQVLAFHVATPPGGLAITAARLIYKKPEYNSWIHIDKEAFKPAGVIDARYW
ncbi:MAG TPA: hypothetical protein VIJ75_19510 [Hanamia sp.]